MGSRRLLVILAAITSAAALAQELPVQTEPWQARFERMSDAEKAAYTNSAFDQGLTPGMVADLGVLVRIRSAVVLPVLERRIEEALKSPSPIDCFVDKTVDPLKVINIAAGIIAYAGDENALREFGKLLALGKMMGSHEQLLRLMINSTLRRAAEYQNPFSVAYRGFDIGDPTVNDGIAGWARLQFEDEAENRQAELKHLWAEAMVEKYGHAPNEVDWANDPLATRMKSTLAWSVLDEVFRLGAEAAAAKKK
jgi:hypothetical protein